MINLRRHRPLRRPHRHPQIRFPSEPPNLIPAVTEGLLDPVRVTLRSVNLVVSIFKVKLSEGHDHDDPHLHGSELLTDTAHWSSSEGPP